jgi:hypothetical protein
LVSIEGISAHTNRHEVTDLSYSLDMVETALFADDSSCTLQNEGTEGPYYVNGEMIRKDLVDGQEGVSLTLDT